MRVREVTCCPNALTEQTTGFESLAKGRQHARCRHLFGSLTCGCVVRIRQKKSTNKHTHTHTHTPTRTHAHTHTRTHAHTHTRTHAHTHTRTHAHTRRRPTVRIRCKLPFQEVAGPKAVGCKDWMAVDWHTNRGGTGHQEPRPALGTETTWGIQT